MDTHNHNSTALAETLGEKLVENLQRRFGWPLEISPKNLAEVINVELAPLNDTSSALVDAALAATVGPSDEQAWNDFCQAWIESEAPIKPGMSASEMAARVLGAEVLHLQRANAEAERKIEALKKRVQWYVDRDSLAANNA